MRYYHSYLLQANGKLKGGAELLFADKVIQLLRHLHLLGQLCLLCQLLFLRIVPPKCNGAIT